MKLAFTSSETLKPETDHTLAIVCLDPRFKNAQIEFLKSLGLERYDLMSVAGGVIRLVEEETSLEGDVQFLHKLHGFRKIVIIAHQDCGYYKHATNHNRHNLEETQIEDMGELKTLLAKDVPTAKVELYYAKETPEGKIGFFVLE